MQFTTRAGLRKPEDPESADIADLNFNSDQLSDYAVGDFICTSVTRPGAPWVGMRIFETDTTANLVYVGGADPWKPTSIVICTSATRPPNPVLGQEIFETDTKFVLFWDGADWELLRPGAKICTSATRPAAPWTGQQIWETDTKRNMFWDGAAWVPSIAKGTANGNTDANGAIVFNHNLGRTPTMVQVTIYRPLCSTDAIANLASPIVWAVSATQITVRFIRRDTNVAFAGNNVGITWTAD